MSLLLFEHLPQEFQEKITAYEKKVAEWNQKMNLVSRGDLEQFRIRHIEDSLSLVPFLLDSFCQSLFEKSGTGEKYTSESYATHKSMTFSVKAFQDTLSKLSEKKRITGLDVGTGAGLPGILLSICGFEMVLVEKSPKKCLFLDHVIQALDLDCLVMEGRIEQLTPPHAVDFITSRAWSHVSHMIQATQAWRHTQTVYWGFKTAHQREEMIQCQKEYPQALIQSYRTATRDHTELWEIYLSRAVKA